MMPSLLAVLFYILGIFVAFWAGYRLAMKQASSFGVDWWRRHALGLERYADYAESEIVRLRDQLAQVTGGQQEPLRDEIDG